MPKRRAIPLTLTPCSRAVRIASTSLSVSRVRGRLLGSTGAPIRASSVSPPGSLSPRIPRFHAETSLSTRGLLFPQRSIASTTEAGESDELSPASSFPEGVERLSGCVRFRAGARRSSVTGDPQRTVLSDVTAFRSARHSPCPSRTSPPAKVPAGTAASMATAGPSSLLLSTRRHLFAHGRPLAGTAGPHGPGGS